MKKIKSIGCRFVFGSVAGSLLFITARKISNFQYQGDYANYEDNIYYDQDILCNNEIKSLRHLAVTLYSIHLFSIYCCDC